MGCKCCVPAAMKVLPGDILPNLPENIIHINESTSKEQREEFEQVIAKSFCGTTKTSPEGMIGWFFEGGKPGVNPTDPLKEDPSPARENFCLVGLAKFNVATVLRHGGCYALLDSSGKIVGATSFFPPSKKPIYKMGMCEFIWVANQLGGMGALPKEVTSGDSCKRGEIIEKVMQKCHSECIQGEHLYVAITAILPGEQGKGYGRKLMEFLNAAADNLGVPSYLECSSVRNVNFYEKNGYKVVKDYELKYKDDVFKPDGVEKGIRAMVRPVGGGD